MNNLNFLYGTAWKEDETERLTLLALEAGFTGIDTANQRRHYHEAGVGAALQKSNIPREKLFLQTKFTYQHGQDHRLPYDPSADLTTQVNQSFASSLEHLGTDYLDSYVLHGPSAGRGLSDADWEVWTAMEALAKEGKTKQLGISNINLGQLEALCANVKRKPTFVQNRCFANTAWDSDIRTFCRSNNIRYQGFSLLTANREVLTNPALEKICLRVEHTPAQVVFRYAQQVGMLPLTGTTNPDHMRKDLACSEFDLTGDDLRSIEFILIPHLAPPRSETLHSNTDNCPSCRGKLLEIVYGLPDDELMESSQRGEIALGGCEISESMPTHRCQGCRKEFIRS